MCVPRPGSKRYKKVLELGCQGYKYWTDCGYEYDCDYNWECEYCPLVIENKKE